MRVKDPPPLSSGIKESRTTLTSSIVPLGTKNGALASMDPRLRTKEISLCPNRKMGSQIKTIINSITVERSNALGKENGGKIYKEMAAVT